MTIETRTVTVLLDDLTGEEIKNGGWALIRLRDGAAVHLQNLNNVVELVLNGGNELVETNGYVREILERRGVIPSPVLSKDDECRLRQPCTWDTCICD